jgi:predicted ATPase
MDQPVLSPFLADYESVPLFVKRAGAVHSSFRLTNENAPVVA